MNGEEFAGKIDFNSEAHLNNLTKRMINFITHFYIKKSKSKKFILSKKLLSANYFKLHIAIKYKMH